MKESINSIFKHYKSDLPAGLVVFLVALPLCLGIALASGAPLFSGIITGIIAGIVVGLLSGSNTSVSGPAAGLTVIVFTAIETLGAFEIFLVAVVIAGVLQLILGYLRAGIIGLFFPSAVIEGMLAAIGLTLILKQLPHFFGVDTEAMGFMDFSYRGSNTLEGISYALSHIEPGAFIVGAVALVILIMWDTDFMKRKKWTKVIPGALVAVIVSVLINYIFKITGSSFVIQPEHLVLLPYLNDPEVLNESFNFPAFSAITSIDVWQVAIVITIIASLETLLSIEAVDKIDPHKRHSPKDRELKAQGVGNIIAGLLGGLPMTAVIVRSSANINAGNKTKLSAIFHGTLLFLSVLLIPFVLNQIPLAALAAILLVVGYKLSKVSLYKQKYQLGMSQFLPFIVTIIAVLFSDLLTGIGVGMVVAFYFILKDNYNTAYFFHEFVGEEDGKPYIKIELSEHVSFLNKARLARVLEKLPSDTTIIIDGRTSKSIDLDALGIIRDFANVAHERKIDVRLVGIPEH